MSRLSFLFFGGDIKSSHTKRMCRRLTIAGVLLGLAIGITKARVTEEPSQTITLLIAGLSFLSLVILAYESYRFYHVSDEFIKAVITKALAISGAIFFYSIACYAIIQYIFTLPSPPLLTIAAYGYLIIICSWVYIAWKST